MIPTRVRRSPSINTWRVARRRFVVELLEDRTLPSNAQLLANLTTYLPPQHQLLNQGGFLTAPSVGSAIDIARSYLASHASDLGLTPHDLEGATVTRDYVSDLTGTTHLTFQQSIHGLVVANANLTVNVSARGQIINVGGGFVPQLSQRANEPRPSLSPVQAVKASARALAISPALSLPVLQESTGITRATVLTAPGVSMDDISVHLQYVAISGGGVALAWNMDLRTPDGHHWYNANVDARTGALLSINDWTHRLIPEGSADSLPFTGTTAPQQSTLGADDDGPSYNVFARPVGSPSFGERSLESNPSDPVASPAGWHDTRGGDGSRVTGRA